MCGVPPQEGGEGSRGGSHHWPDIALASRSEALTWQRRAAGARIAAPDSRRFAARATDGVGSLWRCSVTEDQEALGSQRATTSEHLSNVFLLPATSPSTMWATRILNCLGFVLKRQITAAAFHVQTSSGAEGKHSCETPRLAPSPVLFGVREVLILTSSKAKSLSSSMLLSANY